MVVIANATKYGTGALINPNGKLDDAVFEVVVKKIPLKEILKCFFLIHLTIPQKQIFLQKSCLFLQF
jgi:diacylglycerol kinase (ATP)